MDRIGACGKVVSAVMRNKVTTEVENGVITAVYEGEVIMRNNGKKLPTGNAPNAATHMRMLSAGANAAGLEDRDWMLYFEDDAQLHADIREAFASPDEVQKLLKWSFKVRCLHFGAKGSSQQQQQQQPPPTPPLYFHFHLAFPSWVS